MNGERIVEIARSYVGVPWKHQGRSRTGLDCVGLVYRVWCDLGFDPAVDGTGYGHVSDGRWLRRTLERLLVRTPGVRLGGVVLMTQPGLHPLHLGIVSVLSTEDNQFAERNPRFREDERVAVGTIVHANARVRKVIEQPLVPALGLRPVAYYRFPEVGERMTEDTEQGFEAGGRRVQSVSSDLRPLTSDI